MEHNLYGFVGCPIYDLVFHLSLLLGILGKRILVVDLTAQRAVISCLGLEPNTPEWEYGNVMFRDQLRIDGDYDVVMLAMDGKSFLPRLSYRYLLAVTDGAPDVVHTLHRILPLSETPPVLLLRDMVSKGPDTAFYREQCLSGNSQEVIVQWLDERSLGLRRKLAYGIDSGISSSCRAYERDLIALAQELFDLPKRVLQQGLRHLKGKKYYDDFILE